MHIFTGNFDSIFSLGVTPFFNLKIWPKWKIVLKQFASATHLKQLNRISWNFVVMKDIMCGCAYPQDILIQFFFSQLRRFWNQKFDQSESYYWFSVRLPVINAWNCIFLYTAFSSNVGAWGMWASLLTLSSFFFSRNWQHRVKH